ncbi:MAG: hypothetical protein GWN66_21640 [Pseudomonas stutzeri]|nr:hypothetical protein [Stutzerimonas stutzeri]NIV38569.1 hypothetical protein [Anaerolineae bacterium]
MSKSRQSPSMPRDRKAAAKLTSCSGLSRPSWGRS